jgi:hypothetical protein
MSSSAFDAVSEKLREARGLHTGEFLPCDLAKRLRSFPSLISPQFADTVLGAEVFDFGRVDASFLKDAAIRGSLPFIEQLIRVPFPVCVLRYRYKFTTGQESNLVLAAWDRGEGGVEAVMYDSDRELMRSTTAVCRGKDLCDTAVRRDKHSGEPDVAALAHLAGLLMILNTKGIRREVIEPTKKEQRKRRDQGKPPLKRITHIDTRHYVEACKNTDRGGTHASPVPHRRRGHLRQLPTGKQTWVRDCIVNVRSREELEPRTRYQVVHNQPWALQ